MLDLYSISFSTYRIGFRSERLGFVWYPQRPWKWMKNPYCWLKIGERLLGRY